MLFYGVGRRAAARRRDRPRRSRWSSPIVHTGLVPRVPTAILVTGMIIVAVLCFFAGLILDTVTRGRREIRRLAYLARCPARAVLNAPRLNLRRFRPM